jgi:hypothetical protein
MINAYALDKREIEPLIIQEVADDLSLSGVSFRPPIPRRDSTPRVERSSPSEGQASKPQAVQLVKGNRGNGVADHSNIASASGVVPEKFFIFLREALIDAMGPMAHIVLAEHVKLLGSPSDRFPQEKVDRLVDSVSREIFDESIRARFRRNMAERISALQRT